MDKRVTIYDVAKELGVSTATVNRALNNKRDISEATRIKVLQTAERMGYTASQLAKNLARPAKTINFLIHNSIPVFHDEIIGGVRRGLEQLAAFNVKGEIIELTGSPADMYAKFLWHMERQIEKKPDALLMVPVAQSPDIYNCVRRMHEAGIKVGVINCDLPGSLRLFSCRQDAFLAGRMAAELLSLIAPAGKLAIFTGHKDAADHILSVEGFRQEAEKRRLQIAAIYENHDDADYAAYNTRILLKEHPDVDGIYINTSNSIAVCETIKRAKLERKIKIIASDIFHELVKFMEEDVIQATIFQEPFRQGRQAIKHMYRYLCEDREAPSDIMIRPRIILQSNLHDYSKYIDTSGPH